MAVGRGFGVEVGVGVDVGIGIGVSVGGTVVGASAMIVADSGVAELTGAFDVWVLQPLISASINKIGKINLIRLCALEALPAKIFCFFSLLTLTSFNLIIMLQISHYYGFVTCLD